MANTPETTNDHEVEKPSDQSGEHPTVEDQDPQEEVSDIHRVEAQKEEEGGVEVQTASTIEELRQCLGDSAAAVDPEPDIKILPSDSVPSTPIPAAFGLDSQAPGNVVSFPDIAESLRTPKVPIIEKEATESNDSEDTNE